MGTPPNLLLIPILLLATTARAQQRSEGRCTTFQVQPNFDYKRYLGQWHGYSKYETLRFGRNNCSTVFYSDDTQPGGTPIIAVNNRGYNDKIGAYTQALGQAYPPNPSQPAQLIVNFFNSGRPITSTEPNYNVLSTDYTNYAVVYSCMQLSANEKSEMLYILSRERQPAQRYVDQALEEIKKQGIDTTRLKKNVQTDCPPLDIRSLSHAQKSSAFIVMSSLISVSLLFFIMM